MSGPRRSAVYLAKDLGGLALYYPGQAVVARSPRRLLGPLSVAGGAARGLLAPADTVAMIEELRLLMGDRPLGEPAEAIVSRARRLAMFNDVEVLRYPHMTPATVEQTCVVEGREHLDAALDRGRGALVLIGHFGANQMIMPALGHLGYPMNQLSAPPTVWADILRETRTTPLWERVLARRWALEQRLPVRHINVFQFLRPAFECLARNEVLGLAFDGGGGTAWTDVRLLARRAWVSVQPAQLWRKTGAALVPGIVLRSPGEPRHRVILEPPLSWEGGPDRPGELRHNLQRFVDRFAVWVERYPCHYLPFLLLRRNVRGTDARPFFDDYPPLPRIPGGPIPL